ncbi:hypothetical protein [Nocardioides marmotae]|uniref:hypothetical protein n=1 Tax=Nocardioides marmotae TaxID=2663857 RepID=UPI0012B5DA0F|nr:hypothetical protein [Nocardioides marmotae]MBC9735271.1 hypothetical protein [Nocardioides marmotae]MTB86371.1 hypothetical protein [Nocardioides marmotae]
MTTTGTVVYSQDRTRRLRLALYVALGVGAVVAAYAVWVLVGVVPDDADALTYGVSVAVVAAVVLASTGLALRLLPSRSAAAKRGCVVAAVLLLPASVVVGQLGFVAIVVSLSLLFLALIADDPSLDAGPGVPKGHRP